MNRSAKALQIIIASGEPTGLKVVLEPGWSGKCFIVPRQNVLELRNLPDAAKPGLYMLFGTNEELGSKIAYIGESESVFKRISSHTISKDFWDTAVIFTGDLNRAHVKYLEHRATLLAAEAKRTELLNKVQPQENSLSDYDMVAIDQYFEHVMFILSSFSYELFDRIEESIQQGSIYHLNGNDFEAIAQLLDNGNMLVRAGSRASIKESNSFGGWAKNARVKFIKEGKLKPIDNNVYELTEDIVFRSPSGAAATIAARSINGWTAWKDPSGNTLDDNIRQ